MVVGEAAELDFTIYTGDAPVVIGEPVSTNPAVFFTNFDPRDSLIAANDSLVLTATFAPGEIGTFLETMQIWGPVVDPLTLTMRGGGVSPLQVNITPYNPPNVIPETGGSFDFNILLRNLAQELQTVDLWTEILLPGFGSVQIMTVTDILLPGNLTVDRDRTQVVPEYAPAGTYTYIAYIGDYPWVMEDFDLFQFDKAGDAPGGSLGSPSDWLCTGEDFEGSMGSMTLSSEPLPTEYALLGAFPNPFNPTTTINYALPEAAKVSLTIYDISGRLVAELVDGWREAGTHDITFDGSALASGVYIYSLSAGEFTANGKMVFLK